MSAAAQVHPAVERLQRALERQQAQIDALQRQQEELKAELQELRASGAACKKAKLPSTADLLKKKRSSHSCLDQAPDPIDDGDLSCASSARKRRMYGEKQGVLAQGSNVGSSCAVTPEEKGGRMASADKTDMQLLADRRVGPSPTTSTTATGGLRVQESVQEVLQSWMLASVFLRMAGLYTSVQLKSASAGLKKAVAPLEFAFSFWFPAKIYAIGGSSSCNQGAAMSEVDEFDPRAGTWTALPPLDVPRKYAAAACAGAFIYVVGGHSGQGPLAAVERYNSRDRRWEECPEMSVPRHSPAAAVWRGYLYVIGGHNGRECLATAERMQLAELRGARWELAPSLQIPRMSAYAVALDNSLFVLGGMLSWEGCPHSAEQLVLERWVWDIQSLPRPPTLRLSSCTAVIGGTILSVGGYVDKDKKMRACNTVEACRANKTAQLWQPMPALKVGRLGATSVVADGQVYVLGGSASGEALKSVETLKLEDQCWRELPSLSVPRVGLAAVASRIV
mmetsp:Transcript_28719/g.66245  ORF Transcript_28719/g.66245 Transcript_28719/m.66245 type:complete len:507 (-) Transcript_28719:37-1557(-)